MTPALLAPAFKEWAVVCRALALGRQVLILRKGGIHEGPNGFQVEQDRFWLLPTYLHQQAEGLVPEAAAELPAVVADRPPAGVLALQHVAEVAAVHQVADEAKALALVGQHVWSEATVRQRFHYRRPGLFVLAVRVLALPAPVTTPDLPAYEGCKTWVTFDPPLATVGAVPALDDATFADRLAALRRGLEG